MTHHYVIQSKPGYFYNATSLWVQTSQAAQEFHSYKEAVKVCKELQVKYDQSFPIVLRIDMRSPAWAVKWTEGDGVLWLCLTSEWQWRWDDKDTRFLFSSKKEAEIKARGCFNIKYVRVYV